MIKTIQLLTKTPEETQAVGYSLGANARAGDIFLLTGPLGAGKTCLTQGIARGLGVEGYVRSPTFVIMTRHHGRLILHHVDLYRITGPDEAWDLGMDEQLSGGGVCVVEWADRAAELFPESSLWVDLAYCGDDDRDEDRRTLSFSGGMEHQRAVLEEMSASSNDDSSDARLDEDRPEPGKAV
jgi:tRNA threonylcarbamoyladenosine biosynthesis protein TsaE